MTQIHPTRSPELPPPSRARKKRETLRHPEGGRERALLLILAAVLGLASQLIADAGYADDNKPADRPRYETRTDHDPEGIGKFYLGREIAQVMGHEAAEWLERPEREQEEKPEKLLDALQLKQGDVVADIGAGSGYFAFRLAKRVGPTGKVLAVDIQPQMLSLIRTRMQKEKVENIKPILGEEANPRLPANAVDLILMVDVYHEFAYPWEMTQAMIRALKPGGRLVFVEYRKEDPKVWIKLVHKMTQEQVKKEMKPHPVAWVKTLDVLPTQHIIIFKKNKPERGEPKK